MKQFILLLIVCTFCISITAQPIPLDNRVRTGVLENGMHYYIQHNEKPENRAEIRLAVDAGSVLEDDDQQGLAHFVEHMAFNGTKHFEKNELVDYLEGTGAKFGPDLNAYTSFDETVYMLQVRTDDEEILSKGLLIFEDWAGGLTFDPEEIDKERGVVKSEWRSRLSPDERMQKQYFPVLYYQSQYANRLPIGQPEIIEHAPYSALSRFYDDWYRPDLMAIIIVGDIDVEQMEAEIVKRFSKLKNPGEERSRTEFEVPTHDDTKISIASDEESSFTSVRMLIKHPHQEVKDLKDYRRNILHRLYNGMMNNRLGERAREADPPYSFAFSGYGRDLGNIDRYSAFARTGEGESLIGLEAMLTEIERARRFGFTESELERQKSELMSWAESAVKDQDKIQSRRIAMGYVYHFLDDNPMPGPTRQLDLYQSFLPTITLDEINALSDQWLTKSNRVFVLTGPDKAEVPMPSEEDVKEVLTKVENMELEAYEDTVIEGPLFEKELKPGEISEVVTMESIGVEEWKLSNGVKVVVKKTDFTNDEVMMRATSEGGTSLYDNATYPSARFASGVVNESGVSKFDNVQLEKKLSGKIVSVSPYIGENFEGFYGSASPEDLELLFQLTYLYFTEPREDEQAYESFITRQKNLFENLMSNPNYYFSDYVARLKTNDHPRRGFPTVEDLNRMDLEKAMSVYKDRFSDASDFTFIFVGNFEMEKLKDYAQNYLATLPSTYREETWNDIGVRYKDGVVEKSITRGKAPKTQVDMSFHGDYKWNTKNNYLFNSMLGALRIKLREAMREDKGGVYGVRVGGNTSKIPIEEYSITISFNSEPDRTEELIETATEVIKKYQGEAFDETDINKVKEIQTQDAIKGLKENRYWIQRLENAYEMGTDPEQISLENLEEKQELLTPDHLLNSMQQYFDWNNYFKIVMSPEAEPEEG